MILVVDDHQDVAQVLVKLLQKSGYQAEMVNDGTTALRFLEHIRPEAVLLDVMMPGMDGVELLRVIRQDALCGDVPVVMFSADGTEHRKQEAMKAGASGYLVKGMVDWYDLRSYLERIVRPPQKLAAAGV
jgi:two-component system alkaline phosphatase synthesis response regulator PhoP